MQMESTRHQEKARGPFQHHFRVSRQGESWRQVCIRAGVDIENHGTTPGCQGCDAILMRSTAKTLSAECRERSMTKCNTTKSLREESKPAERTARGHVQAPRMSEMQSDPEPCSRIMLRTRNPVQSPAVTGTKVSQVSVTMQCKHLRNV